MATTRTIRWLAGGGFVDKEVTSSTVAQLRAELDISPGADIAVDGTMWRIHMNFQMVP